MQKTRRASVSSPKSGMGRIVRRIVLAVVMLPLACAGIFLVYPDVASLRERDPGETSFMRYREREWKKEGKSKEITRKWVPLSRISPYATRAVLISEDDKFWTHEGFDFEAIEEAAKKNLHQKRFKYGGSTISQQLAKNLYLGPGKNLPRKAVEAILTWRIEHTLSKPRILELYMNVAEWGDGIFGIEAASRTYFHTSAAALTAEQAARLAAVLPNPRKYRPDGDSKYIAARAERILSVMAKRGELPEEYGSAVGAEPPPEPAESPQNGSEPAAPDSTAGKE